MNGYVLEATMNGIYDNEFIFDESVDTLIGSDSSPASISFSTLKISCPLCRAELNLTPVVGAIRCRNNDIFTLHDVGLIDIPNGELDDSKYVIECIVEKRHVWRFVSIYKDRKCYEFRVYDSEYNFIEKHVFELENAFGEFLKKMPEVVAFAEMQD